MDYNRILIEDRTLPYPWVFTLKQLDPKLEAIAQAITSS